MAILPPRQSLDGQDRFDGGANMIGEPSPTAYRYSKNLVVRSGFAKTRPGIRRAWRALANGFTYGFWFNEDAKKYNDAEHTGFWFPFDFVRSVWGATIQGFGLFRFPGQTVASIIVLSNGVIYTQDRGVSEVIPCAVSIGVDEQVTFQQVNQFVYMFRGEDLQPVRWDGSKTGFVLVPDATGDAPNNIPWSARGEFIAGRLWVWRDRDDFFASDILDPTGFDYANAQFSYSRGDGDEIVRVYPFHADYLLVFKRKRVGQVQGINSVIQEGTGLANYVVIADVDDSNGAIASNAIVTFGEQVAYLAYRGVCVLQRNQQNHLQGLETPLSAAIQPLIDRINWPVATSTACAATHDNYLLFAVPLDDATHNNAVLVYDLLANGGQGAWLPLWQSEILRPRQFFTINEGLFFLGQDGVLRQMFTDDPWDSDEPVEDTPIYDGTVTYRPGDHVRYVNNSDGGKVYVALAQTTGNAPSDADYWEEVTDPQNLYRIETEFLSRPYRHNDQEASKALQRGEVVFGGENPKLKIELASETYNTREQVFPADGSAGKEYDRTKYNIADVDDWDASNINLDFQTPHRDDYFVFIDETALAPISSGPYGETWTSIALGDAGVVSSTYLAGGIDADFPNGFHVNIVSTPNGRLEMWMAYPTAALAELWGKTIKLTVTAKFGIAGSGSAISDAGAYTVEVTPIPTNGGTPYTVTNAAGGTDAITILDEVEITLPQAPVPLGAAYYLFKAEFQTDSGTGDVRALVDSAVPEVPQFWIGEDDEAVELGIETIHSARFVRRLVRDRAFNVRVTNTQGKLSLKSIRMAGQLRPHAIKEK